MKLIDMHCDTLWRLLDLEGRGDLMENPGNVSIIKMRKARSRAQFFACFTYIKDYIDQETFLALDGCCADSDDLPEKMRRELEVGYDQAYVHVLEMADYLADQARLYAGDIKLTGTYGELQENVKEHKISAILTVEEGGILNGRGGRLEALWGKGVRLMTLLWNYENCIGYPNSRNPEVMRKGLKPFGIETVERMNEMGMIIDVSHASDKTAADVLEYSKAPVAATHSNCRAVCSHPRNLSDELIRKMAEKGGVAGLNFYGPFLGGGTESSIDEMTAHLLHMIRVGGSNFPAIGTDFDGFDGMEKMDIPDISMMELLWEALKKKGISESQLDKIWRGNAERLIREQL